VRNSHAFSTDAKFACVRCIPVLTWTCEKSLRRANSHASAAIENLVFMQMSFRVNIVKEMAYFPFFRVRTVHFSGTMNHHNNGFALVSCRKRKAKRWQCLREFRRFVLTNQKRQFIRRKAREISGIGKVHSLLPLFTRGKTTFSSSLRCYKNQHNNPSATEKYHFLSVLFRLA